MVTRKTALRAQTTIPAMCLLLWFSSISAVHGHQLQMSRGQTIYVPVYSHIYSGDREHPFNLTVTLSLRNTDPVNRLSILSVNYHASDGKLVKRYLEQPLVLGPLMSTRYVVHESDTQGGSGASFVVVWNSKEAVSAPVMEAVMIGTKHQQGISFLSPGRVVRETGVRNEGGTGGR